MMSGPPKFWAFTIQNTPKCSALRGIMNGSFYLYLSLQAPQAKKFGFMDDLRTIYVGANSTRACGAPQGSAEVSLQALEFANPTKIGGELFDFASTIHDKSAPEAQETASKKLSKIVGPNGFNPLQTAGGGSSPSRDDGGCHRVMLEARALTPFAMH